MPNFCSTFHCTHHYVHHPHLHRNKYEPSKMFGLINCEHKGYVGFEFDDYPDGVLIQDMEKPTSYTPNSFDKNGMILLNVINTQFE